MFQTEEEYNKAAALDCTKAVTQYKSMNLKNAPRKPQVKKIFGDINNGRESVKAQLVAPYNTAEK